MTYEELANKLRSKYSNITVKRNKLWVLTMGDLYIVKIGNGRVVVRRNWWNPFLLVIIILLDYVVLSIGIKIIGLHLRSKTFDFLWILIIVVTLVLNARDNRFQKNVKGKLHKDVEKLLESSS